MSIQPSANQVANIYQGNPGALNARIQQEQKGKPGLPPDLTKLMALNINTNEQDAAKRQQAMTALQSMQQQGGGEPPTVAQTIQQQAMQKAQLMQQQMQQMQPKPQGLMALLQARGMPQAPENAPRPDRQPSGIDELQSNVGQNFDGGGIVAFNGENESKVQDEERLSKEDAEAALMRMLERTGQLPPPEPKARLPYSGLRQVTQRELAEEFIRKRSAQREEDAQRNSPEEEARRQALVSQIPTGGQTAPASNRRGEESELDRNISNTLAALPGASVTRAPTGIRALAPFLASLLNRDKQETAEKPTAVPSAPMDAESQKLASLAASQSQTGVNTNPALKPAAPAPANKPNITNLLVNQQPPKPAAPPAPPAAPPAPASKMDQFLASQFDKTPEQRRLEAMERYKSSIGDPDTAAQERYIKQLEESRSRFAEPTDFAGRLSQWARATANAGGRSSLETGAKGSAALEATRQSNAQKDIETLKELMAESSKVADTKRGYKKELVLFGEKEYEEAYKNAMDATKEMGLDKRERERLAHQTAENALNRKNQLAVASTPSSERLLFNEFTNAWLKKAENKGKSIDDAYAAFRMAGSPSAGMKGVMTRDQAEDNFRKDMENFQLAGAMKKEAEEYYKKQPTYSELKEYHIQKQMSGSGKGGASTPSSGRVVEFNSLPK